MTKPIGLVRDPIFARHDAGRGHPERPERYHTLDRLFDRAWPSESLLPIATREATIEELTRIHPRWYVEEMLALRGQNAMIDADTRASEATIDAALRAAGGVVAMVEALAWGKVDRAFAVVRPPGHHAEPGRAMGFCFFSNIAIAATAALELPGIERVAILDWDVHHGNGTQAALYDRSDVFFVSLHQWPLYPGSGQEGEIGRGPGKGYTLNFPLSSGADDQDMLWSIEQAVLPALKAFKPDMLLVSAGYDGHQADPLAGLHYTERGYQQATQQLLELIGDGGKIGFVLEGGYNLAALESSVQATVDALLGRGTLDPYPELQPTKTTRDLVQRVINRYRMAHEATA